MARDKISSEDDDNRRVLGGNFDSPEARKATEQRRADNLGQSLARRDKGDDES